MFDLSQLPNQRPDEKLVIFLRRYWLTLANIVGAFLLLTLLPAGLAVFFSDVVGTWLADPVLGPVVAVLTCMYLASVWLFAFMEFTDWYLDTWIVTTERIINVEQHGLFSRTASELHLMNIQDVTSEVHGLIRTFLNFGNVYIQTAAERERFNFKDVHRPEKLREQILRLVDEDRQRHGVDPQPKTPSV